MFENSLIWEIRLRDSSGRLSGNLDDDSAKSLTTKYQELLQKQNLDEQVATYYGVRTKIAYQHMHKSNPCLA